MKKRNFKSLMVMIITISSLAACKKNGSDQAAGDRSLKAGVLAECDCTTVPPAIGDATDSTISGQITGNLFLSNVKNYKLSGLVFVTNNATVTVQAGARIVGLAGAGTPGGTPGGGLVVTRGSKLIAVGTSKCPIVFTSYRYNNSPLPGDWSGVVLLGKSTSNQPSTTAVEGIGGYAPPGVDIGYGGNTITADNSGTLKFVRIEYAGYELEVDKEINGLTLAGVGSGTTIDYVEVYKANDDAFEWFGGTVNASHLIAVDPLDDMFDTDHGYSGTISYALGLADPAAADKSQSNGLESDNSNVSAYNQTPNTHPTYNYLTVIGVSTAARASVTNSVPSGTGKYGRAAHLRRNAEFSLSNSIFMGYNFGLSLDDEKPASTPNTPSKYYGGTSTLTNNYTHAFYTATTPNTIAPYIEETNGTAATAAGFKTTNSTFYSAAILSNNNKAYANATNANASIKLANPFVRNNTTAAANYLTTTGLNGSPAGIQGAFPGRVDWTIVDGCYSWTRYTN